MSRTTSSGAATRGIRRRSWPSAVGCRCCCRWRWAQAWARLTVAGSGGPHADVPTLVRRLTVSLRDDHVRVLESASLVASRPRRRGRRRGGRCRRRRGGRRDRGGAPGGSAGAGGGRTEPDVRARARPRGAHRPAHARPGPGGPPADRRARDHAARSTGGPRRRALGGRRPLRSPRRPRPGGPGPPTRRPRCGRTPTPRATRPARPRPPRCRPRPAPASPSPHLGAARAWYRAGRYDEAVAAAEQAAALATTAGRSDLVAESALAVGWVSYPDAQAVIGRLDQRRSGRPCCARRRDQGPAGRSAGRRARQLRRDPWCRPDRGGDGARASQR